MYGVLLQYFSTFFLIPLCGPLNHGRHCVCDTYLNIQKMNFAHIRIILSINIVISLYGFDRLVFVIEPYCVDCEVGIDLSHIICSSSDFFYEKRFCF